MPIQLHIGDCIDSMRTMPAQSVQTCITSPPYFGLRDYGHEGQIGLEATPDAFVEKLVEVFREVRRVLRDDGTLWLNLGDSYNAYNGGAGPSSSLSRGAQTTERPQLATGYGLKFKGLKPKDLIGIPWRVAFALQADGWYLRQDIIWHKPNPMPESTKDRCTKAHEYLFLLSKSERYYFDSEAMQEPATGRDPGNKTHKYATQYEVEEGEQHRTKAGLTAVGARQTRNRRSVWTVATRPYKGAHFATFPPDLIEPCVLAGAPAGGVVLDPFGGSGTTAQVALKHDRRAVLCELNPAYEPLIWERLSGGFA